MLRFTSRLAALTLPLLVPLLGCSDDESATPPGAASVASSAVGTGSGGAGGASAGAGGEGAGTPACSGLTADPSNPIGGDRPVEVLVPKGYDPKVPAPLLVMLHGYTATGALEESYLQIAPAADQRGMLYAHPDGTVDTTGQHFWNATDACCNIYGSDVDDSTYLRGVIDAIGQQYCVDRKQVFVMGHSNGGFMSYRMACDHADAIAAIASLAGATFADVATCKPSEPVGVLEIHGTADATIAYGGGSLVGHAFPSAETSVKTWAAYDGCSSTLDTSAPPMDLEAMLPGTESRVSRYGDCSPGGAAELWTIEGGSHIPAISATFTSSILDYLLAHPKP